MNSQEKIEERIGSFIENAATYATGDEYRRPDDAKATTFALLAIAEALDGIRQALVRGALVVGAP